MLIRTQFLFPIWYFGNQVAFREKHFFQILAKIQEIKLEGTSAEPKYAKRRLQGKTLPCVSLNEENLF